MYAGGSYEEKVGNQYIYWMAVCRSGDGGVTWYPTSSTRRQPATNTAGARSLIASGSSSSYTCCKSIAVAATDPNIVYAGGVCDYVPVVYRSSDGIATWADVTGDLSGQIDRYESVVALWVNPADANHVLAGGDGGLFVSTTGGTTWQPTALRSGVTCLSYDAAQDIIYVGTGSGVFYTTDRGVTWRDMSEGLASKDILCLDAAQGGPLFVGTSNAGAWQGTVDGSEPIAKTQAVSG